MLVSEVIQRVKDYHQGTVNGKPIDESVTRDKILYGNPNVECTGIVTTCWATVDVIREAHEKGANLIICHEALFWNHGDHQEWLQENENKTYLKKKKLLDDTGIVVWRDHDYIHSGIPVEDGSYTDGIFYGIADKLGWVDYIRKDDLEKNMHYEIPETTMQELAEFLVEKLHLNGVKVIGNKDCKVSKVRIPLHILADANDFINEADKDGIQCFLTMELIDFTLTEYIRDSSMFNFDRSIIGMGHFNLEEPGMEYMLKYLPKAIGENIPLYYIQSGDNYDYVVKK